MTRPFSGLFSVLGLTLVCAVLATAVPAHAVTLVDWDLSAVDHTTNGANVPLPNPIAPASAANAAAGLSSSNLTHVGLASVNVNLVVDEINARDWDVGGTSAPSASTTATWSCTVAVKSSRARSCLRARGIR